MSDPDDVIDALHALLRQEPDLEERLTRSLQQAGTRAQQQLDPTLYDALSWPSDLDSYDEYLRAFLRWIPQQTDAEAWKASAGEQRQAKEVSDRLAHFYWLVDQSDDDEGHAIGRTSTSFRDWLTRFAREWGSFLDTPDSLDQQIVDSFLDQAPEYGVEESLMADGRPNTPSGWLTFNQFFARELNPGLRPVAQPGDNRVPTCPADCSYMATYDVDEDSNIPAATVKGRHYGNITELLEGSDHADAFAGGTFVHYELPPSAYHRYHLPVSGRVLESFVVPGRVYMQVELQDGQLVSLDSAKSGYEFSQTHGAVVLDTADSPDGDVGLVAVVPVGMSHVASVNLTALPGTQAAKGQEFGFFQFGGSDIIVLFQAGANPQIDTSAEFRRSGSEMARVS